MVAYIFQVILFQLLFLIVYELLLKKETFFNTNRCYLIFTALVSLLLPFIHFEFLANLMTGSNIHFSVISLPEDYLVPTQETTEKATSVLINKPGVDINWWLMAYFLGVIGSLKILIKKYQELERLFRFRCISSDSDREFKIIEVPNSNIACTFYRTIFLGDKLTQVERQQILPHELVHVKQKHSLDLVFFEIMKLIFWFNPLIYIYQNRITTLHEFIADASVVQNFNKRSYYEQLLNRAFDTHNISFINQFFSHSIIKKRIVMLEKSRSRSTAKLKYLVLLPIIFLMLTYVGFAGNVEEIIIEDIEDASVESIAKIDPVPFAVVEESPIYPGCEQDPSNSEEKECMRKNITNFVNQNISRQAVELYTQPTGGNVTVVFEINQNGKVANIKARATSPRLDKEEKAILEREVMKTVSSLPQMQPGKHQGEIVGVAYAIRL